MKRKLAEVISLDEYRQMRLKAAMLEEAKERFRDRARDLGLGVKKAVRVNMLDDPFGDSTLFPPRHPSFPCRITLPLLEESET